MPRSYYLTTPIYYVNDAPHIGTCYCTIATDIVARFHRLRGEEVLFATGTDENATKVAQAAKEAGKEPLAFVDGMAKRFRDTWDDLGLSYDVFIRTTEARHAAAVQHLFRVLRERGDIYEGTYEGWYCIHEETYFGEDEILTQTDESGAVVRLCPDCKRPVQRVSEQNYFFALSRYSDRLLAYINTNRDFLQPEFRRNEVLQFINAGLRDVCISRKATEWGIPVPDDPSQVIYVWFDALINYITVAGYPDDLDAMAKWWPADLHLVGKDIYVRFHCTLWPAMLMAAGLEPPRQVFGHGFWLNEGVKISKSLGNAIDFGQEVAHLQEVSGCRREIAIDALRFFLFRQAPFGQDADFSRAALVQRFNGDLANDLGNAVNRSLNMTAQNFERRVPPSREADPSLKALAETAAVKVEAALEQLDLQTALVEAGSYVAAINKFIDERAPWRLAKEGKSEELGSVLYATLEACRLVSVWITPFMPNAAAEIQRQLGIQQPLDWEAGRRWGGLRPGDPVEAPQPIFPRVDAKALARAKEAQATAAAPAPATAEQAAAEAPASEHIGIEDFAKVQLRVAQVLSAERVPKADKLLHLRVSLGSEERTVLAGIAEWYEPESLVGRKVVMVANLAPRKMRGLESQGMLLAAEADGKVSLLQPDQDLPPGASVR